jgi:hypothetical protein
MSNERLCNAEQTLSDAAAQEPMHFRAVICSKHFRRNRRNFARYSRCFDEFARFHNWIGRREIQARKIPQLVQIAGVLSVNAADEKDPHFTAKM